MDEIDYSNKKKAIASLVVGITALAVMVIGATYAYFTIGTVNNFGTSTIDATISEPVGSVTLSGTNAQLKLNLTTEDFSLEKANTIYYATLDGTPTTNSYSDIIVATTELNNDKYYDCNYEIEVSQSGTMYDAFQLLDGKANNEIYGSVSIGTSMIESSREKNTFDFNTTSFPVTYSGTMKYVSSKTPFNIYTTFAVVNDALVNQSSLAGTKVSININAKSFVCNEVIEPETRYFSKYNSITNKEEWVNVLNNIDTEYYAKNKGSLNEVCIIYNDKELCLDGNAYQNKQNNTSMLEEDGATCSLDENTVLCTFPTSLMCSFAVDKVTCGYANTDNVCSILPTEENYLKCGK